MALGLPRGWLRDTAGLYARVFRRGAGLALRNWWVGLVVIVYDVLVESYQFIGENWIEWFPANLALLACVLGALELPAGPLGVVGAVGFGVVLYFAAIVRGLLFQELSTSSRRGREFWRRAAG